MPSNKEYSRPNNNELWVAILIKYSEVNSSTTTIAMGALPEKKCLIKVLMAMRTSHFQVAIVMRYKQ